MASPLVRRAVAEFLGTGLLVATVVGSGVMGTLLSDDLAVVLLVNAVATVAALGVLIWMLGPISGAHFNPVVTGVEVVRREMPVGEAALYVVAQVAGALGGVALANLMFDLPAWQASTNERTGWPIWLGEIVATAGLLLVIGALTRTGRGHLGPGARTGLDRRRLLLHVVDVVRQPGRHDRAKPHRHLLRDRSGQRADVHRVPGRRRHRGRPAHRVPLPPAGSRRAAGPARPRAPRTGRGSVGERERMGRPQGGGRTLVRVPLPQDAPAVRQRDGREVTIGIDRHRVPDQAQQREVVDRVAERPGRARIEVRAPRAAPRPDAPWPAHGPRDRRAVPCRRRPAPRSPFRLPPSSRASLRRHWPAPAGSPWPGSSGIPHARSRAPGGAPRRRGAGGVAPRRTRRPDRAGRPDASPPPRRAFAQPPWTRSRLGSRRRRT